MYSTIYINYCEPNINKIDYDRYIDAIQLNINYNTDNITLLPFIPKVLYASLDLWYHDYYVVVVHFRTEGTLQKNK